ncbi:MAG: hypothetical protein AAFX55_18170 [Bacteroidota bacterium]
MKTMYYLQEKWQGLLKKFFQNTALKSVDTRKQVKGTSKDEEPFLFI